MYIHYSTTVENSDILNSDQTVEVRICKLAIKINTKYCSWVAMLLCSRATLARKLL